MDISIIILHIEALVFASDKPLTALELTELINNTFGFMEDKITLDQIESAIEGIVEKYNVAFYPFEMKESGGGWQFLTKKEYHKTVAQLNGEKYLKRLSSASLETMSIIAYKQPITKGEIESIRGVNSDYSIQKLLEKELIVITGRNEELPGKPLVFGTSKNFMDYFGINSADELPRIKEVLAEQVVEPTFINEEVIEISEENEKAVQQGNIFQQGNILKIDTSLTEEEANSRKEETEMENKLEQARLESIAEDKNMEIGEDIPLVVRGNGELIEETSVVNEDTPKVDLEIINNLENDSDHNVNQHMKKDVDEEDRMKEPEN